MHPRVRPRRGVDTLGLDQGIWSEEARAAPRSSSLEHDLDRLGQPLAAGHGRLRQEEHHRNLPASAAPVTAAAEPFERLSQYALFAGDPKAQEPAPGVIPYDLNSALFSDYAAETAVRQATAGCPCRLSPGRGIRVSDRHDHCQDVRLSARRA